jgi:hypothetical protein
MPTKSRQVAISVAMVMPDTGFDEVPMRPTMREATVTKKKTKTRMSTPSPRRPASPGKRQEAQWRRARCCR